MTSTMGQLMSLNGSQAAEAIRFTFIRTIWKHLECNQSIQTNQYAIENRRINQHQ